LFEIKARNRRRIGRFVEDFVTQRSEKRAGRSRIDLFNGLSTLPVQVNHPDGERSITGSLAEISLFLSGGDLKKQ